MQCQGYPMVVQCANLPVDIQNGNSVGGSQVVGWLPINTRENRILWISSRRFGTLHWITLLNLCIKPLGLIMKNSSGLFCIKIMNQVRAVLQSVAAMRTKGEQNKLLSELGLHGIEHLRPEVISCIDNFDRKFRKLADEKFMTITFTDGAKYEDLSKQILFVVHNIITKQQDSHGYLLLKCICSYLKLDMYSDLHMHITKTLQAIEAQAQKFGDLIQASWLHEIFLPCLKVMQQINPDAKSWNFPKVHSLKHTMRDIMEKGATCNYNTKPNEKMHGSLKDTYQLHTNFKGVAEQILCVDQWYNAASFIWQQINLHDKQLQFSEDSKIGNDKEDGNEDEGNDDNSNSMAQETEVPVDYSTKASLHGGRGKGRGSWKLEDLESQKNQDPAFTDLCQRLLAYMIKVFEDHPEEIPMWNNKKVMFNGFQPYDKIQLYGLLKTYY
ncbi:hypothetical protein F5146DRAFT_1004041 [Armillaria mellea]|nr:hypothetical protein F5146DRAFT_1004041 [Armillaria mellea]